MLLQAYKALQEFRVQMAIIRLQASISEPNEVIDLVCEAIELEDYIKSGAFSKQGDPFERWDRIRQLRVRSYSLFECIVMLVMLTCLQLFMFPPWRPVKSSAVLMGNLLM